MLVHFFFRLYAVIFENVQFFHEVKKNYYFHGFRFDFQIVWLVGAVQIGSTYIYPPMQCQSRLEFLESEKKCNLGKSQGLKSTFFEIISNGASQERPAIVQSEENLSKTKILAFEVISQPLIHTLFRYLSEQFLMHSYFWRVNR